MNIYYRRLKQRLYRLNPNFWDRRVRYKAVAKYAIAGIGASSIDLVALYIFHGVLEIRIITATSLAFLCSFMLSFNLQKFWTFSNRHSDKKAFSKQLGLYLSINFVNINVNGALMYVLVNNYKIWYLLSQVISGLIIGALNFLVYKFIIFRSSAKNYAPHN